MHRFRVSKTSKPKTPKVPKIPKPLRPRNEAERLLEVAAAIAVKENEAMVSCTECIKHNVTCYYDREQSVKCADCLKHQRTCDGTFSLEEFREIGEQKKKAEDELFAKRQLIAEARRKLLELEDEGIQSELWLRHLKDVSDRMIQREMAALGVLHNKPPSQQLALGDQSLNQHTLPSLDQIDFSSVFFSEDPQGILDSFSDGGTGQQVLG